MGWSDQDFTDASEQIAGREHSHGTHEAGAIPSADILSSLERVGDAGTVVVSRPDLLRQLDEGISGKCKIIFTDADHARMSVALTRC